MNVIFVDIDGPLLPRKMHIFSENRTNEQKAVPKFDEFAVRCFNLWAKYGNAKIVFSTYWEFYFTADELKRIMHLNGLAFDYHEDVITPKRMSSTRNAEIASWLDNHPEVENFIAVDDDTSCKYIDNGVEDGTIKVKGRWVEVDFDDGISWENFCDGCVGLGIDINEVLSNEFDQHMGDSHHTGSLW